MKDQEPGTAVLEGREGRKKGEKDGGKERGTEERREGEREGERDREKEGGREERSEGAHTANPTDNLGQSHSCLGSSFSSPQEGCVALETEPCLPFSTRRAAWGSTARPTSLLESTGLPVVGVLACNYVYVQRATTVYLNFYKLCK